MVLSQSSHCVTLDYELLQADLRVVGRLQLVPRGGRAFARVLMLVVAPRLLDRIEGQPLSRRQSTQCTTLLSPSREFDSTKY